jgi:hypothetical protein
MADDPNVVFDLVVDDDGQKFRFVPRDENTPPMPAFSVDQIMPPVFTLTTHWGQVMAKRSTPDHMYLPAIGIGLYDIGEGGRIGVRMLLQNGTEACFHFDMKKFVDTLLPQLQQIAASQIMKRPPDSIH